jgi:hypothetical protein
MYFAELLHHAGTVAGHDFRHAFQIAGLEWQWQLCQVELD